jgi:LmbE family N-acetylglucosaminyl deacetylase
MKRLFSFLICAIVLSTNALAQVTNPAAGEILIKLKKLNVLGSAMHIAAHPDDENSLLLAYLAKDRLINTYYTSLTRGDGGQNLIGPEQGEYIGVIRTQELLAARRIDGAQQLFTRAYDFGFSKTREETLGFWGEQKILADVVYLIRKHRPDVLITRFPPDERAGHGHHNSSAYLALEAFKIAADPTKFPEQLKYVQPWQPKRVVWNTYSSGFQNNAPSDPGGFIKVDLSGYNPLLGKSYNEIAAESRSMHKTQGFGVAPNRNLRVDYMLHKDGVPAKNDLFDNVDLSWIRVKGSQKVSQKIQGIIQAYTPANPSASVPGLVEAYKLLQQLDGSDYYVQQKKQEIQSLIKDCLGLWFETNPSDYSTTPGGKAAVKINILKRAETPVTLVRVQTQGVKFDTTLNKPLSIYEPVVIPTTLTIPQNTPLTQPYWLRNPIKDKIFQFDDQELVGLPENNPDLQTSYTFLIGGATFIYSTSWQYKYVDPSVGEIYRPFEVRPATTVNLSEKVIVFPGRESKPVQLVLKANEADIQGKILFTLPNGWRAEPSEISFATTAKYEEQTFTVNVYPSAQNSAGKLLIRTETNKGISDRGLRSVEYRHIPTQTLFPPAETELVKLDISNHAKKIGYIAGAGDEVPAALRQMGCEVTLLDEQELGKDLSSYDAIVVGVRAYNTEDRLIYSQPRLMDYVKNGGTMVVQYVTARNGFLNNGLKVENMGPFPFEVTRDRVTDENAVMKFLNPNDTLLSSPNKITEKDFDGWIQERGIYFASDFEKNYQPVFGCNDPGESEKQGSLIYTKYGKGYYIYTGLSFFRELPAGVPGAYRIFANLISAGK